LFGIEAEFAVQVEYTCPLKIMKETKDLMMNILICPPGFKESLEPHLAADCIEEEIL
jgi:hypothetical protein